MGSELCQQRLSHVEGRGAMEKIVGDLAAFGNSSSSTLKVLEVEPDQNT